MTHPFDFHFFKLAAGVPGSGVRAVPNPVDAEERKYRVPIEEELEFKRTRLEPMDE